jgi:hypothetical protein
MEGFVGEEVGVVDDGDDEFAFGVERAGFGDEAGLAFMIVAGGFELHGLAEEVLMAELSSWFFTKLSS